MACMPTLSPLSPIACGGTGVIIPTVGVAILTIAGTAGTALLGAGDSAGAAGTVAAGGGIITTITTIRDIITAVMEAVIGLADMEAGTCIPAAALRVLPIPAGTAFPLLAAPLRRAR